jgi:hypothetical protein
MMSESRLWKVWTWNDNVHLFFGGEADLCGGRCSVPVGVMETG